jgi:hypothetical protein
MAVIYFNNSNVFWKATNNNLVESWLDSKSDAVTKKTISESDYLDCITLRKIPSLNNNNINWTNNGDEMCSWKTLDQLIQGKTDIISIFELIQRNNPELPFLNSFSNYVNTLNNYDYSLFNKTSVTIEGQTQQRYIGHNFDDILRRNNKSILFPYHCLA